MIPGMSEAIASGIVLPVIFANVCALLWRAFKRIAS